MMIFPVMTGLLAGFARAFAGGDDPTDCATLKGLP